jgi:hypothetical protein
MSHWDLAAVEKGCVAMDSLWLVQTWLRLGTSGVFWPPGSMNKYSYCLIFTAGQRLNGLFELFEPRMENGS